MLNIHPSLLPEYQGLHTHARVLAAGERQHGASVHFVDGELDGGPAADAGASPRAARRHAGHAFSPGSCSRNTSSTRWSCEWIAERTTDMGRRDAALRWRAAAGPAAARLTSLAMAVAVVAMLRPAMAAPTGLASVRGQPINVSWRGMTAGTSATVAAQRRRSHWAYDSRSVARGVFRIAVPDAINQSSVFTVRDEHVLPLQFRTDDGRRAEQARRRRLASTGAPVGHWYRRGQAGRRRAAAGAAGLAVGAGRADRTSCCRSHAGIVHDDRWRQDQGLPVHARRRGRPLQTAVGPQRDHPIFRSSRPDSDRSTLLLVRAGARLPAGEGRAPRRQQGRVVDVDRRPLERR